MLYIAGIALGLAAGVAARGNLRRLADGVRLPWVWLVFAALGAQLLIGFAPEHWMSEQAEFWILTGSYAVVVAWLGVAAAANEPWVRAGLIVVGVGTALNLVAIVPNRGIPVSREALRAAGAPVPAGTPNRFAVKHVIAGPDTVLNPLGDVIPLPPVRDVISAGDILIVAGVAMTIAAGMRAGSRVVLESPAIGNTGLLDRDTTVSQFLGRFAREYAVGQAYEPMSEEVRHPADARVMLSQAMGITDANLAGNVHGGVIMKLVDTAAGLSAVKHAHGRVVTVSMDEMSFLEPVFLTDVVTLYAQVNDVGRTSMEVGVRVEAENTVTGERRHVSSAYLVFVALDGEGKPRPVPRLEPESDAERRRMEEAKIRRSHRIARKEALLARRAAEAAGEPPPPLQPDALGTS